jgi:shikimate kinase
MGRNIILIGFMGVGKTTLGKKLANTLGYAFVDTDQWIENKENNSVATIFGVHGEAYFREKERQLLDELPKENTVISTGGGLPCEPGNIERLKRLGYTIYLERPPKELAVRLRQGKTKRPLIADLSIEELLDFITEKLAQREIYYRQCDYIAPRNEQTPEKLIYAIKKSYQKHK